MNIGLKYLETFPSFLTVDATPAESPKNGIAVTTSNPKFFAKFNQSCPVLPGLDKSAPSCVAEDATPNPSPPTSPNPGTNDIAVPITSSPTDVNSAQSALLSCSERILAESPK